jgi:hypothetical protein
MTIESSNPASGSTIASGSQIEVVNSIPLVISTIKLRRTGWDDETIYSGGVFTSGYTGTRAVGSGVEVFTIRKDGYGWTESPFQIVLHDGATETSLNFYVTGVSVYPEFMTPFGTGGSGGSGTGTGARYLDELQDVTAPSPGDSEVLGWDAGLGQWTPRAPTTPGAHVLDSHTDVTITGPQNDEVLTYQAGVWVNQAAQGGAQALDDLTDVTITNPQDNHVLAYDSGTGGWINQAGGGGGVTDHGALTGLSDDDHAQYHNNARGDARYVPLARTVATGSGLTGGGDLSANRTLSVSQITNSQITSATVADNYVLTADGAGNVNWEVQQGPPGGAIKWTLQEILTSAPIDNNVTTQPANPVILTDTPGVPGTTSLVVWKQNTGDTVPPMQASVPGNADIGISVDGPTASLQIRPTGVRAAQGNAVVTFGGASHATPSDTYVFGSASTGASPGGNLDLRAGQSTSGGGGNTLISGGASAGAGQGGYVSIDGGDSISGATGKVYIGAATQGVVTDEVQIGSAAPGTSLIVYDYLGSTGSDGQVLTSTGLLTRWEDPVGGTGIPEQRAIAAVVLAAPKDTLITSPTYIDVPLLDYDGLDVTDEIHLYVNGVKQRGGATSGADFDFYPAANQVDRENGRLHFEFALQVGDVVEMIIPGTAGGGGATSYNDLTDVVDYTGHADEYVRVNPTATGLTYGNPAGSGDVVKSGVTANNRIARWNGTDVASIKNTGITVSDTDDVSGIANLSANNASFTGNINMLSAGATVDGVDLSEFYLTEFVGHVGAVNPHNTGLGDLTSGTIQELDDLIADANIGTHTAGDIPRLPITTADIEDDAITLAKIDAKTDNDSGVLVYGIGGAPTAIGPGTQYYPLLSNGTGATPSFAKMPYSSLANGTDGQIITWDANGVITAIGPGDSGQVLTSQGTGNPPIFAAGSGAPPKGRHVQLSNSVIAPTGGGTIDSMTLTPPSGTYLCTGAVSVTLSAADGTYAVYFTTAGTIHSGGGVTIVNDQDTGSTNYPALAIRRCFSFQYMITVNGSQTITMDSVRTGGTTTCTVFERELSAIRVDNT